MTVVRSLTTWQRYQPLDNLTITDELLQHCSYSLSPPKNMILFQTGDHPVPGFCICNQLIKFASIKPKQWCGKSKSYTAAVGQVEQGL